MNQKEILAKRSYKTVYKVDDTVIKVFEEGYPKSNILNEALNHARVEEAGLKIPSIRYVGTVDNCWSITMDYIPGKTLEQIMDENPVKMDELLEQFVDLQIDMHTYKAPLLNKLKDKLVRKIQSVNEICATTKYELLTRLDSMPKHTKLCHGDFLPSNIIINESGAYIIDWSHATQGNASADVANTYLKLKLKNSDLAERYLKLFCRKSDTALQYIQQWIPIVAAPLLLTATETEKEFLLTWLDILDFQ